MCSDCNDLRHEVARIRQTVENLANMTADMSTSIPRQRPGAYGTTECAGCGSHEPALIQHRSWCWVRYFAHKEW